MANDHGEFFRQLKTSSENAYDRGYHDAVCDVIGQGVEDSVVSRFEEGFAAGFRAGLSAAQHSIASLMDDPQPGA